METESKTLNWTTQIHKLRGDKYTFTARRDDGFYVEFKPFESRSEAATKGQEMLNKIETEK